MDRDLQPPSCLRIGDCKSPFCAAPVTARGWVITRPEPPQSNHQILKVRHVELVETFPETLRRAAMCKSTGRPANSTRVSFFCLDVFEKDLLLFAAFLVWQSC